METTALERKTKWIVDPTHSELMFRVKHLMITHVKGEFTEFNAEFEVPDNDLSRASVSVTIDAGSVFTNEETRDTHLRSGDFFDVENFPELTFKGTSFEKIDSSNYKLTGELMIKGVTREIVLEVEFGGITKDPWGNEKAGFSLSGKLNRKDFGLNWNTALEAGGVLVGDEVKIAGEIQFVKQAEQ